MKRKEYFFIGIILLFLASCFGIASAASSTTPTNLVVDFDSTYVDSDFSRGDNGILNLVIKNTGGQRAEKATRQNRARRDCDFSRTRDTQGVWVIPS